MLDFLGCMIRKLAPTVNQYWTSGLTRDLLVSGCRADQRCTCCSRSVLQSFSIAVASQSCSGVTDLTTSWRSIQADGTVGVEIVVRHLVARWPWLCELSLLDSLLAIFCPSEKFPDTPSPAILPWVYVNVILESSQTLVSVSHDLLKLNETLEEVKKHRERRSTFGGRLHEIVPRSRRRSLMQLASIAKMTRLSPDVHALVSAAVVARPAVFQLMCQVSCTVDSVPNACCDAAGPAGELQTVQEHLPQAGARLELLQRCTAAPSAKQPSVVEIASPSRLPLCAHSSLIYSAATRRRCSTALWMKTTSSPSSNSSLKPTPPPALALPSLGAPQTALIPPSPSNQPCSIFPRMDRRAPSRGHGHQQHCWTWLSSSRSARCVMASSSGTMARAYRCATRQQHSL
jgi:hypothetical protein